MPGPGDPYLAPSSVGVDELVRAHLPLVKKIALHLLARLPASIELDDLMQAGMLGLLHAREQYRETSGASFNTYAGIRVKGAMLDELRGRDWLPRRVQSQLRQVAEAIEVLAARKGAPPGSREIAEELGVSLEEYQQMAAELACARMLPLDDDEETFPAQDADPAQALDGQRFRAELVQNIATLPEKEGMMMSLYYDEGLNLKEIGMVLGVSESRVSQLHGQALARLRAGLAAWSN